MRSLKAGEERISSEWLGCSLSKSGRSVNPVVRSRPMACERSILPGSSSIHPTFGGGGERSGEGGVAQIRVDQDHALARIGHQRRQIAGNGGLAFVRQCGRYADDLVFPDRGL